MTVPVARVSPGEPASRWEVRVPGSKSITNRALLLAGFAGSGTSTLTGALMADDTLVMAAAIEKLGATVERSERADGATVVAVGGIAGPPTGQAALWCGQAGTVGRFLLPMLAAGTGSFELDAHEQLRRRPLGPVLAALRAQGAVIDGDAFPLLLDARGLEGGDVDVDASVSSQFLSGLLMAAPLAHNPSKLKFDALVSRPYLDLTLDAMREFGVDSVVAPGEIVITPGPYFATDFEVEPDASTASYFLASAAITGTTVRLPGLSLERTRQGDIELVRQLKQMGCTVTDNGALELSGPEQLHGVEVDMADNSDVFMTLACVAPFADAPTLITGIGHARVKESDRITATAENLRALGIEVDEGNDYLRVHPGDPRPARLPTYDDHRIAMAFSLIGTHTQIELEYPEVVGKTCPTFFSLWPRTGASVELPDTERVG